MADLNELNSSGSTKLVGSDSSGAETNYVNASVNGLRIDGSAVTQPISAASLPLPTGAATESTLSSINTKLTDSPYGVTLAIAAADTATTLSGNLITGTPTSSSFAPFNISNLSSGLLQITGTWVGTIVFEVSQDGTNYIPCTLTVPNIGTVLSTTVNTQGYLNLSGVISVRARATSWTSGFASINLYRNSSLGAVFVSNPKINVEEQKIPLTGSAPATASVTTTSSTAVTANSNRKGAVITLVSGARVFLAFGANNAVANRGIMLTTGGTYVMDDYTFTTQAIQAITASGSAVLAIQEFT